MSERLNKIRKAEEESHTQAYTSHSLFSPGSWLAKPVKTVMELLPLFEGYGLVREYKEETGADIKVGKLLWTEECFWEWNGTQAHNIAFYYLIELADGSDIPTLGSLCPTRITAMLSLAGCRLNNLQT